MADIINTLLSLELKIIAFFYQLQAQPFNSIMVFFTRLGDAGAIWIALSILLLFSRKYRKAGLISLTALLICSLIVNISLKPLVQRIRPFDILDGISLLIRSPKDYSFPSGHTAASFAAVYVSYRNLRKFFPVVLATAILISFSRLYLSVHFPTDIIAGAVIGLFSGFLAQKVFLYFYKLRKE